MRTGETGRVLAHVGSAPVGEVLMVLAPVSLLALALLLANRRANRMRDAREQAAGDPTSVTRSP